VEASYLTFRITYAVTLLGGCFIMVLIPLNQNFRIAGLAFICVAVFQALLFTLIYRIMDTKH
jgi:hypothetical protein